VILDRLDIGVQEFQELTGWTLKPEGACHGEVCVPLGEAGLTVSGDGSGGAVDLPAVADRLGMPLLHDDTAGVWALGPASVGGRALTSAEAPELVLPDLDGRPFRLSSLRGQKVVLVAWAPY